jgi:hypothetical protein
MKYKMIRAEDYKNEPVQFIGYYVLHSKGLPPPEVFFVEEDKRKEKDETE